MCAFARFFCVFYFVSFDFLKKQFHTQSHPQKNSDSIVHLCVCVCSAMDALCRHLYVECLAGAVAAPAFTGYHPVPAYVEGLADRYDTQTRELSHSVPSLILSSSSSSVLSSSSSSSSSASSSVAEKTDVDDGQVCQFMKLFTEPMRKHTRRTPLGEANLEAMRAAQPDNKAVESREFNQRVAPKHHNDAGCIQMCSLLPSRVYLSEEWARSHTRTMDPVINALHAGSTHVWSADAIKMPYSVSSSSHFQNHFPSALCMPHDIQKSISGYESVEASTYARLVLGRPNPVERADLDRLWGEGDSCVHPRPDMRQVDSDSVASSVVCYYVSQVCMMYYACANGYLLEYRGCASGTDVQACSRCVTCDVLGSVIVC